VLNSAEAREMAKDNPYSFLHINKPEIDLEESIHLYDERVYQKGAENLRKFIERKIIFQDAAPRFYVYKQVMGQHEQVGLVACASVEEYEKDLIKKHELTRQEKEDDRVNHIDHLDAQVGPVFLTYRAVPAIDAMMAEAMRSGAEYDFVSNDGIRHVLWVVDSREAISGIEAAFQKIPVLYVADGHHRSAAAKRIKQMRQAANPNHTGKEEYNYFLTVIFPHNQMQILDYNRVVTDLNGLSAADFLQRLSEKFVLTKIETNQPCKPAKTHEFGMYLAGQWYKMETKPGTVDESDPVKRLDVSLLQETVLSPLLGISDPRKDKRIDFVGGIRGLKELEKRVNSGEWAIAFAMYPTSIEELMAIADAGKIMPPKSTWFEPKLKSGLVVHKLD
jgi:uncharacterized protein (DUF1015 family)